MLSKVIKDLCKRAVLKGLRQQSKPRAVSLELSRPSTCIFGEKDFYILVDLPDNVTTSAVTLAGNVTGTFSIDGVALLTPEGLDKAIKKSVDFRPPGH